MGEGAFKDLPTTAAVPTTSAALDCVHLSTVSHSPEGVQVVVMVPICPWGHWPSQVCPVVALAGQEARPASA